MTSVLPSVSLTELTQLTSRASTVIQRLRERVFSPGHEKQLNLRFNVRTAAEMVGRTEKAIRDAEGDGRLQEPDTTSFYNLKYKKYSHILKVREKEQG